jgi:hypothetical protein
MIITTMKGKPCSVLFILFNLISFCTLKYFVLGKSIENVYYSFIVFTLLSLTTCFVYIVIDIYIKHRFLKKDVNTLTHIEKFEFGFVGAHSTLCILKVKKNMRATYRNTELYHCDRTSYMQKLQSRYDKLNNIDKMYIYFYEYINTVLMSILLFSVFQVFFSININSNILNQLFWIICLSLLICFTCFIIIQICLLCISMSMKKRDLMFFISK